MPDNNNDRPLELAEAAQRCPGQPHYSALWRWCRKGIKVRGGDSVRLGHFRIGGRIYTTRADLSRFLEAVAEADAAYFSMPRSQS